MILLTPPDQSYSSSVLPLKMASFEKPNLLQVGVLVRFFSIQRLLGGLGLSILQHGASCKVARIPIKPLQITTSCGHGCTQG